MRKGVVMEVGDRFCTVLTDGGAFVRVPRKGRSMAVGEVLSLPADRRSLPRRPLMLWSSSAALAMALLVFVFAAWPFGWPAVQAAPAAYISIDINPSVELGLDQQKRVMTVTERNRDMAALLDGLALTGLPVDAAVRQVMEEAERKLLHDRTEADIVITSVLVDESASIVEAELQASVQTEVERVIREHHAGQAPHFRVTVWSAPKEVLQEAEQSGLSAGQFTFYLKAKASGVEVSKEELQNTSIHQVAKQHEEKQLLGPDPAFTKETIRGLLKSNSDSDKKAGPAREPAASAGGNVAQSAGDGGGAQSGGQANGQNERHDNVRQSGRTENGGTSGKQHEREHGGGLTLKNILDMVRNNGQDSRREGNREERGRGNERDNGRENSRESSRENNRELDRENGRELDRDNVRENGRGNVQAGSQAAGQSDRRDDVGQSGGRSDGRGSERGSERENGRESNREPGRENSRELDRETGRDSVRENSRGSAQADIQAAGQSDRRDDAKQNSGRNDGRGSEWETGRESSRENNRETGRDNVRENSRGNGGDSRGGDSAGFGRNGENARESRNTNPSGSYSI